MTTVPAPFRPAPAPVPDAPPPSRAADYERVVHRLLRREFRLLGELAAWAPADDAARRTALTRHADLLGRVLLAHSATERDLLWPALLRVAPDARGPLAAWSARAGDVDRRARDLSTAARQWAVAGGARARDGFALACLDLAGAVDAHTAAEEADLLPLLAAHLPAAAWAEVARAARTPLSAREQVLVLGLALENACPAERARMLSGLGRGTRLVWRLAGRRRYRAAVVQLRGAPPAA